jgi:pSer/pThr/pTyr-binding forkhead associated (FHA) protein
MLQPVSVALKFGFLVVLYLFLVWVTWSALRDMRRGERGTPRSAPAPVDGGTSMYDAAAGMVDGPNGELEPRLLVERAAGHQSGAAYDIPNSGATLGRGDVEIQIEDPFASARHAQITRQGYLLVIEDLGSTNGTYLNGEPLRGPQPLHPGDRIRIGDSEFSYLQ